MEAIRNKRPVGIAILAWLHIIGGALGALAIGVPLLRNTPEAREALSQNGMVPFLLLTALVFLCVLACLSGIGLWLGRWWGWFLGAFYHAYGVVRNVCALVMIPYLLGSLRPEELAQAGYGLGFYCCKHAARIIVHTLIYLYFFKADVRRHFGLSPKGRWLPALGQFAICYVITMVFSTTVQLAAPPGDPAAELLALDDLYNRGQYQQVINGATEHLEKYPDSYQGWSQLGWAHLRLEHRERAKMCFHKAIELEPYSENAYMGLGMVCRVEGDLAAARANYQKAASLVADNAEAFSNLVAIELMDGNNAGAVEYGEKAWALHQNDPALAANLAVGYHYSGDLEKRDAFYQHAEELGYPGLNTLQEIFAGKISVRSSRTGDGGQT